MPLCLSGGMSAGLEGRVGTIISVEMGRAPTSSPQIARVSLWHQDQNLSFKCRLLAID
jgi:hypothetical protein